MIKSRLKFTWIYPGQRTKKADNVFRTKTIGGLRVNKIAKCASDISADYFLLVFSDKMFGYSWPPPGVMGIWGEWLFIFRDLGSTGNYFRGSGEQAHSFGDLGSPAKKQKKK